MKHQSKKFRQGFSIAEVLMAAFVLTVGIVAAVGLIATSIRHSGDSRDAITAAGLAQEGVELTLNIRDNNFAKILNGVSGAKVFNDFPTGTSKECRIDKNYTSGSIACTAPLDFSLRLDGNNYFTHNTTGTTTKFSRKIVIDVLNEGLPESDDEASVVAYVIWGSGFPSPLQPSNCTVGTKCVFSQALLTNWR